MQAIIRANLGLVLAGLLGFIVMGAGQSMYGPALPAFGRAFGLVSAEAGVLISAHWVGCALGVGLMLLAPQRFSPRHCFVAMAVGAAIVSWGVSLGMTLLGAVAFGAGYGASTVIYNGSFLMLFGRRGPAMVALLNGVFGIGAIGAPLAFIWSGSQIGPAYGAVAVLAVLLALLRTRPVDQPAETATRKLHLRPMILGFGAMMIGAEACLIGLGPTGLIAVGQTEAGAARLLSLFFLMFLITRLVLVVMSGLLRPFTLLALALAASALSAVGMVMIDPATFFVAMGISASVFFPAFYVAACDQMGSDPRTSAVIIAAGLAGGISTPLALGVVMERMGNAAFFPAIAILLIAASLGAFAVLARMNRAT